MQTAFFSPRKTLTQSISTCKRLCSGFGGYVAAFLAGSLLPLSLTPFNCWPLSIVSLTLFAMLLWQRPSNRSVFFCAVSYGLGLYAVGISWVFVSIYHYGAASLPLATLLTGLFVAAMAVLFGLPFLLYRRFFFTTPKLHLAAFPLFWSLSEWLRTWLFTGFPWLFAGYSFTDHGLNGWAPVIGVTGLGLLASGLAAFIALWCRYPRSLKTGAATLGLALILFASNPFLTELQWTKVSAPPIKVAIVQPNIAQELKWQPWFRTPTLERLTDMSEPLWAENDWIVWPEAAIPQIYHEAYSFISSTGEKALQYNSALITGILTLDPKTGSYHNSIIAAGNGAGMYHKQRLVPFGEYVPLEEQLRGLIAFFDLPTSIISAGENNQKPLQLGNLKLSPFICYEVVYPGLIAAQAKGADVLITVSNDAWFGESIGPLQHMQMARMRALETGRYMIRGTNTGVSALINNKGQVTATTPRFSQSTFSGTVQPRQGNTPFMALGNLPLYLSWAALLGYIWLFRRKQKR